MGGVRRTGGSMLRVLVVVALALAGVALVAVPAQASVALSTQVVVPYVRLNYSWTGTSPAGPLKAVVTSTTDSSQVWTLTFTDDTQTTSIGVVPVNMRDLDSGGGTMSVASVTSPTGLDYLPNGSYTAKVSYVDTNGVTMSSTAATFTAAAFTATPSVTAPTPSTALGATSVGLDVTFPQTPKAQTARAVFTGRQACSASQVTYSVTQVSPVPTHVTASLGIDGTLGASSTGATQTGSFVRGCSYDLVVSWQNVAGSPGYPGNPADPLGGVAVADLLVPSAPDAPTSVQAVRGDQRATVSWTAPSTNGNPISGYTVTSTPGSLTCTSVTPSCTVLGLANGTPYTFAVTATNGVGTGTASDPSPQVVPAGLPLAPTGVTAERGDQSTTVGWQAADGNGDPVTSYTATAAPSGQTCTTSGTSCAIAGLANGVDQTVTVVATNGVGAGAVSAPSGTVRPAGVPGRPADVLATPGDEQADVSWSAADARGNPVSGYVVTASPGGATCATTVALGCTVTGLTNGQDYAFTVVGSNDVGAGTTSLSSNTVRPAGLPGAASAVTATAGSHVAQVQWEAADGNGSPVLSYGVTASPGGGTCTAVGTRSCSVTGLTNGTAYSFSVVATNGLGQGPAATSASTVTPAGSPGSVLGVSALAGDGSAHVSWTAPSDTGGLPITGYTATAFPGGAHCTTSALQCSVPGLANGTAYSISVYASTVMGNSPVATAPPVVPRGTPGAPTWTSLAPGTDRIALSWSAPDDGGSPVTTHAVTTVPASAGCTTATTSCTLLGLRAGRSYVVRLVARNALGTGSPSTLTVQTATGGRGPSTTSSAAAPSISIATSGVRVPHRRAVRLVVSSDRATTVQISLARGRHHVVRDEVLEAGTHRVRLRTGRQTRPLANGKRVLVEVRQYSKVIASTTVRISPRTPHRPV